MPRRDCRRLGVFVPRQPGESAMSMMLRAFQANGVAYQEGMQWLGLDRRQALVDSDVVALAWALHAEVDDVRRRMVLLEWRGGGRWVHLAGQRLSRWIAPTTMLAKLCPECLREAGYARLVWLTRAVPGCCRHGYSLLQECGGCHRPVRWARPGLRICQCGRYFKPAVDGRLLEPEVRAWIGWAEAVLQDDVAAAQDAIGGLPPLLHNMTLDGAYRMIEAFGLLKAPGDPVRDVRHSSAKLPEVGAMVVRGLQRLWDIGLARDVAPKAFDVVHLPVLRELADEPAAEGDGQRAAWLLDLHRATRPTGQHRVGARPRRQMPLFL
ncbi:TniQ family protein [Roseateles sp.]|uniref:TniQ family protein n=1 Tax=Roseateles sp. TaxID=1971397 RepID=UPI0025D5CF6C|nr:TniQ family protein [Roseateles sp.]